MIYFKGKIREYFGGADLLISTADDSTGINQLPEARLSVTFKNLQPLPTNE